MAIKGATCWWTSPTVDFFQTSSFATKTSSRRSRACTVQSITMKVKFSLILLFFALFAVICSTTEVPPKDVSDENLPTGLSEEDFPTVRTDEDVPSIDSDEELGGEEGAPTTRSFYYTKKKCYYYYRRCLKWKHCKSCLYCYKYCRKYGHFWKKCYWYYRHYC